MTRISDFVFSFFQFKMTTEQKEDFYYILEH